jgi:hypothetical protein
MLKIVFCDLHREISPLSVQKNHLRWCRKSKRFEWYPSKPPIFWLDNIFKVSKDLKTLFSQNLKNNSEFYADFETIEKNAKNLLTKKLQAKEVRKI